MWKMRNTYKILVKKSEKNRPLERSRHRLKDNVKMDLNEIWCEGID